VEELEEVEEVVKERLIPAHALAQPIVQLLWVSQV